MATRRSPSLDHEEILLKIDKKIASDEFQERISSIELILQIYRDVPKERTVDQLTGCLERLAADTKWEVRKASIRPLIELRRPGVRNTLERLAKDPNKWVRRQAEDGKKRLVRITGDNKGANFVYEATKGLGGSSAEKIFKTALEVGEKHYQEFAADIAHELNTYSAVMQGFLRELELSLGDEGLKGETEEIFAKLQERSGYLQKLVDDLVVYTRDVDLTYEWHPLEPILREAVDIAFQKTSRRLDRRSVDTSLHVQGNLTAQVCRDRFERAVTNFVSNALEAMAGEERERKLQIDARLDEIGRLQVSISDSGRGMDAAQLENAKKRFGSGRRGQGGIGLGLPLAFKIIEAEHGGQIEMKSRPGIGTTIVIRLALERET